MNDNLQARAIPYAKIVLEPSPVYRMRYEAENRKTFLLADTDNSNNETNSKTKNNGKRNNDCTYPRIEIVNGQGPATLIVSCINKNEPYHVHPHKLVGDCCKSGVAVINIQRGETVFDIVGVSIQFTKKSDIEKSIQELKNKNVDPFNVGFNFDRNSIDLSQIRLCFQVYLRDSLDSSEIIRDQYHILKPIYSQIISNTSRKTTLTIIKSFNLYSSPDGGSTVIILIKKLEKEQRPLKVKFYDTNGWCKIVDINDNNIHYQSTIYFQAPVYDKPIDRDTSVFLKLFVPFKNENEKEKYIRQQQIDDEDSMDFNTPTTSSSSSTSLSSSLDGQFESKQIEFIYKPKLPSSTLNPNLKRKQVEDLFGFTEQSDKEVVSDINAQARKKLNRRHIQVVNESAKNPDNLNLPTLLMSTSDSVLVNDILSNNNDQEAFNNISILNTDQNENLLSFDLDEFQNLIDTNYNTITENEVNNYETNDILSSLIQFT